MTDRSGISGDVIVIADRGYESYNVFAHIEQKGWKYAIRVKDIMSNGILSAIKLPDKDEFDVNIHKILTTILLPIRNGRKDPRKVKAKAVVSFLYRVA